MYKCNRAAAVLISLVVICNMYKCNRAAAVLISLGDSISKIMQNGCNVGGCVFKENVPIETFNISFESTQ